MKYSPSYFRNGLPKWKRDKDDILSRYLFRPLSFYLSSLFCEMGWTANMVSYFAVLIVLLACCCFAAGFSLCGAILIYVWLVLDCVDGNIARSVKREKFGDFADSMSSYICVGFMFVCIGYNSYFTGGLLVEPGNPLIILVGGIAGSSDSLARLLYQKYLNSCYLQNGVLEKQENPALVNRLDRVRIKIDAYFGLGCLLPLAVLVGSILNTLDLVVVIWAVYYVLLFLGTSIHLSRKTLDANV